MKQTHTHTSKNTWVIILIAVFGLNSCAKKEAMEVKKVEKTKVTFNVTGIDESISEGAKEKKAAANFGHSDGGNKAEVISYNGFDAQVITDHDLKVHSRKIMVKSKAGSNSGSNALRAAAMTPGNTYNLYLYKEDGTYVDTYNFSVGGASAIEVEKGESYTWYAVSYNDQSTDIVDVDQGNPTVKELALPGNKDILYATDVFEVPTSAGEVSVPVSIVFNHKVARIGIEINTMGMFANMTSATVEVAGLVLKTGSLNLETGNWGTTLTNVTPTIAYSDFVDVDPLYQDAKIAYVYTAGTTATGNFTVTLRGLDLTLDDGNPRSFNTLLTATPSVFTYNITPQIGNTHRALANLIESPLTLEGVRWARQNVYYYGGTHVPYRFHHTYAHSNNVNSYFSFKGTVPQTYGVNGDPCASVYPNGIWRQASYADFITLTGVAPFYLNAKSLTAGTQSGLGYFEYQETTGTASPYPSKNLRFNKNGFGINLGVVGGLVSLDFGSTYGSSVDLWTSTSGANILGLIGFGAYNYKGTSVGSVHTDIMNATLLNVSVIGVDVVETPFRNVRCVRN
ncbi:hypothetical protein ACFRAE_03895 [Sphingobacterium sp. HJSM2_6]|uniref:hypothetical protein n=1 Tax=Sphingobacterium sp. HJSM2_6 TaxID=3366264 RepID=UPI003BC70654